MNLNLFQILVTAFLIGVLIRLVVAYRKLQINIVAFIFWIVLWMVGIFFVLYPDFSSFIARVFGIARGVDVVVYLSIILLFYFNYKLYLKITTLNKRIKKLNTYLALQSSNKNPKD